MHPLMHVVSPLVELHSKGPKSLYPQTGHWDYMHPCDNVWASPPETCDAYPGQKGGGEKNEVPYPNAGEGFPHAP